MSNIVIVLHSGRYSLPNNQSQAVRLHAALDLAADHTLIVLGVPDDGSMAGIA